MMIQLETSDHLNITVNVISKAIKTFVRASSYLEALDS